MCAGYRDRANEASAHSTVTQQVTDGELLDRYASGDQDAFRELYERYDRKLHGLLIRKYHLRRCDRDELAQLTWTFAAAKLSEFDSKRPFWPWLRGIARLEALAYRRKAARHRKRFVNDDVALSKAIDYRSRESDSGLIREDVRNALDRIAQRDRTALSMIYFEGLRIPVAAAAIGIAAHTLRYRLSTARAEMKSLVA